MIIRVDLPLLFNDDKFRERLIRHLTALSPEDRYTRFFTQASDYFIEAYVDRILRSDKDGLFLRYNDAGEDVIGMLNVSLIHAGTEGGSDGGMEFEMGISVDEQHRKHGIGYDLFAAAFSWVTALGAKRVFISCLSTNTPMQKIVKKFNMAVSHDQGECNAITLPDTFPGSPSMVGMVIGDTVNWYALYDLFYRRQLRMIWNAYAGVQP